MDTPFRPQLPPLPGYVEIEVNGIRRYERIKTKQEVTNEQLSAALAEMSILLAEAQAQALASAQAIAELSMLIAAQGGDTGV